MVRRFLVVAGLLILGAGLAIRFRIPNLQSPIPGPGQVSSLQSGPVSGLIQADEILVGPELAGRIQALYADEGDSVLAGQVLAELDTAVLDAQIQQAEAALQGAQAKLAKVKAGPRQQEVQIAEAAVTIAEERVTAAEKAVEMARGNVAAAQPTLQAAQADLSRLRAGPDSYDVALAEAQLELAQQRLRVMWAVRDSTGGSEQRGELPKGSYEAAKAAVAEAETQVRLAELQLQDLKAGPRAEDLTAAQATVEAAQAGVDAADAQVVEAQQQLDAARARLREAEAQSALLKAGATGEQIAAVQAEVSGAQAALHILQVQRKKMTLRAPRDGLILERIATVGERMLPGSALFRLADLDQVELTVYVPESDLGQVQVGQTATVMVDSFPGREFQGQVVYISPRAEFTPRNIQTREERASQVFAVKIELPNPDHALKPGMPADARL